VTLSIGSRIGPYHVSAILGQGGMGIVYRARDVNLDRDVALKILPAAFVADADRIVRFRREARVLASLNHPNIGAIYGFEESDGVRALVLELVEGPTLADRLASEGALPAVDAWRTARQIAEALEAAHEQGVVHRDLKPANIKLRPDGTVKVLDFGVAKVAVSGVEPPEPHPETTMMTALGAVVGTLAYMPPEQARGQVVDRRADIWAFGCVVYEMLTGRRAFAGTAAGHVAGRLDTLGSDSPPPAPVPASRRHAASAAHRGRANRASGPHRASRYRGRFGTGAGSSRSTAAHGPLGPRVALSRAGDCTRAHAEASA
jgi:serine/threonine protein kinase